MVKPWPSRGEWLFFGAIERVLPVAVQKYVIGKIDEYKLAFILHFIGIQLNAFTPFLLYYLFRAIFAHNSREILFNVVLVISVRFLRTICNFIAENRLNMIS